MTARAAFADDLRSVSIIELGEATYESAATTPRRPARALGLTVVTA